MKKLAMGTMMMSAVLLIAASACQAAGRDAGNRDGDHGAFSRGVDRNGGWNRAGDRDGHSWNRDRDRDWGHVTICRSPAYRPVFVCPAPVYYCPAPVCIECPCYRTGFAFSFGW